MQQLTTTVRHNADNAKQATMLATTASEKQRAGIEQVNQAVTQMDQVAQRNAALVEEASVAAESLAQQAQTLRDAVAIFNVAIAPSECRGIAADCTLWSAAGRRSLPAFKAAEEGDAFSA